MNIGRKRNLKISLIIANVLIAMWSGQSVAQIKDLTIPSPLDSPNAHLDSKRKEQVTGPVHINMGNHPDNIRISNFEIKECMFGFSFHSSESRYAGHYVYPVRNIQRVEIHRKNPNTILFYINGEYRGSDDSVSQFVFPSPESAYKNLVSILENMKTCTVDLKLKEHRSEKAPEKTRLY